MGENNHVYNELSDEHHDLFSNKISFLYISLWRILHKCMFCAFNMRTTFMSDLLPTNTFIPTILNGTKDQV